MHNTENGSISHVNLKRKELENLQLFNDYIKTTYYVHIIFMHIIASITSTKYTYFSLLLHSVDIVVGFGRRSSEQYFVISKFLKISGWMIKNILFRRVTDDVEEFFQFC